MTHTDTLQKQNISFEDFKKEVLNDYKIARISRECSVLGRREVLTGKAKFGIVGVGIHHYKSRWKRSASIGIGKSF